MHLAVPSTRVVSLKLGLVAGFGQRSAPCSTLNSGRISETLDTLKEHINGASCSTLNSGRISETLPFRTVGDEVHTCSTLNSGRISETLSLY